MLLHVELHLPSRRALHIGRKFGNWFARVALSSIHEPRNSRPQRTSRCSRLRGTFGVVYPRSVQLPRRQGTQAGFGAILTVDNICGQVVCRSTGIPSDLPVVSTICCAPAIVALAGRDCPLRKILSLAHSA